MMKEIKLQEEILPRTWDNVGITVERAYIAGSGDSYAASLVGEGVHEGFKAVDPYEEQFNIKPKETYIIVSISGKTIENVKLAMKAKNLGSKVIAITANPESPLAKNATETIIVNYPKPLKPLPGTLSFTLPITILYALADLKLNFNTIFKPKPFKIKTLNPIFIGTKAGYGVAYYSVAKLYEIFGSTARLEKTEQFCHATVFSLNLNSQVVIYPWINDLKALTISNVLKDTVNVDYIDRANNISKPLCQIVDFQYSILNMVKEFKIKTPYFLKNRKLLDISSKLIYYH